jgi:DNA-binding response OmpR family regulator
MWCVNGSRILLVEDDEDIGTELSQALLGQGHRASLARTGAEALPAATSEPPDLILLDLGLPDIDGVVLCRRLRAAVPEAIIVVLTARTGEFDVVAALDAGADDYLMKPFRLTELMARLRAHLRRRPDPGERTLIEVGRLRLDLLARRAYLGPAEMSLRPKEFDLLAVLTESAGQVVTRGELMAGRELVRLDQDPGRARVVAAAQAGPPGRASRAHHDGAWSRLPFRGRRDRVSGWPPGGGGDEQQAEDRMRGRAAHRQTAARGGGQSARQWQPSTVAVGPLCRGRE